MNYQSETVARHQAIDYTLDLTILTYCSLAAGLCAAMGLSGLQSLFDLMSNDSSHEPYYLFHVMWGADFIVGGVAAGLTFVVTCIVRYWPRNRT